jgi:hypothetical protein
MSTTTPTTPPITCADLSERLVDYLYQEISPEERQGIEAHLRGCESCRVEVAGLGRTLGRAREALRGPLAEEVPAGVRAEIMRAARAAVPSLAGAGAAGAAAMPGAGSSLAGRGRPGQASDSAGGVAAAFWRWVRRPWFFPAFAAVSAMALFFIARPALMKPPAPASSGESSPERVAEEPAAESPAVPAAPRAEPQSAAPAESLVVPQSAAPGTVAESVRAGEDRRAASGGGRGGAAIRDSARSAAPAKRAKAERRERDDGLAGLRARAAEGEESATAGERAPILQPGGPPRPAAPAPQADLAMAPSVAMPASPRRSASKAKQSAAVDGDPGYASPPPPVPQAASVPRRVVQRADSDEAAVESASEAPAERKGRVGGVISGTAGGMVGGTLATAPTASAALARLPLAELQKRAATAEREGRKADAAAALRELLRRFPDHRDAPAWRTRLEAALR